MEDLISRQDALEAFGLSEKTRKYGGDHSGYATMMMYEIQDTIENLPPIQPERVWSELDKQLIDALLRKIYELQGTSLSMDGVVAKKYYIEELYGVLFGRGEKPGWMN